MSGAPRDFDHVLARLAAGEAITCKECSDFLMAYLDNEIGPAVRERFEQHLAKCASCAVYVETYRKTVKLAQEACCPKANPQLGKMPPELVHAILSALKPRH